jgi:hypothetical protein
MRTEDIEELTNGLVEPTHLPPSVHSTKVEHSPHIGNAALTQQSVTQQSVTRQDRISANALMAAFPDV